MDFLILSQTFSLLSVEHRLAASFCTTKGDGIHLITNAMGLQESAMKNTFLLKSP